MLRRCPSCHQITSNSPICDVCFHEDLDHAIKRMNLVFRFQSKAAGDNDAPIVIVRALVKAGLIHPEPCNHGFVISCPERCN